jgi:acetyl-CoA carboxylase biotin carboxyl carrier protein
MNKNPSARHKRLMDSKRGDKTSGASSAPKEKEGDIFDVKRIRRLVELMNEHELAEIDLRQADQRIRLRKGGEVIETTVAPRPAAAPATPAAGGAAPAAPPSDEGLLIVKSPMIGTFYVSSSPDTPAVCQGWRSRRPHLDHLPDRSHEGL